MLARTFHRALSTTKTNLCTATNTINGAERTATFGFETVTEEEKAQRGHALKLMLRLCYTYVLVI